MLGKVERIERRESRGIIREALLLLPNFLKLLFRLYRDARVPMPEKAFLAAAFVYVISPLDLIPDVIPFIGQVDDLYMVALTLLRLLMRTPGEVIYEYWDGPGDLAAVVNGIARAAGYLLPERIQKILLGRIEIAPKLRVGGVATSPAAAETPRQGPRE